MSERPPVTDDDVRDLLFKAGLTPHEIEDNREAFPIARLVLSAIMKITINRLARQIIAEAMK